jgi:hypothetical protein
VNAWFAGACELVGTQNFKKSHVMEEFCFVQHFCLCVYLDGYLLEMKYILYHLCYLFRAVRIRL